MLWLPAAELQTTGLSNSPSPSPASAVVQVTSKIMDLIDKLARLGVNGLALIVLVAKGVDPSVFIKRQAGIHRSSATPSSVKDEEIAHALNNYGVLNALLALVVAKIRNDKGWDKHEVIRQVAGLSLERNYKAYLADLLKSL